MSNITPAQQDTIDQLMNYDNMQTDIVGVLGADGYKEAKTLYLQILKQAKVKRTINK